MKFTVYHDGQYWVGVVEVQEDGKLKASRHVFGTEPKESELLDFVNRVLPHKHWFESIGISAVNKPTGRINPKRLARQVAKEMRQAGVSTHAQEAMKLEYERRKLEQRQRAKNRLEQVSHRKRELAREKAKARHRGR